MDYKLLLYIQVVRLVCAIDVGGSCRLSTVGAGLSSREFRSFACGECLFFIYLIDGYRKRYRLERCLGGLMICPVETPLIDCSCANPSFVYNLPNYWLGNGTATDISQLSLSPRLPRGYVSFTEACCHTALQCCHTISSARTPAEKTPQIAGLTQKCPATWDGWQCFPESVPGEVKGRCPHYIYGSASFTFQGRNSLFSTKTCQPDGVWYVRNDTNAEWTDYRLCSTLNLKVENLKQIIAVSSFAVSVISIIPAIVIFSSFSALKSESVSIHKNLLASFLLYGVFFMFTALYFFQPNAPGEELVLKNEVICIALFTVQLRYLRMTNYLWMLCEGWYLHSLLVNAFSESNSLLRFYVLGWGFPIIPTIVDSFLRYFNNHDRCWVDPMDTEWMKWVHQGPCLLSLCVNFMLMLSIMYILIRKLRYQPGVEEPVQYRKAVRATIMLLPVFGLHFMFTIYRVNLLAYEIVNTLLDGLQGFGVACIICYGNHKVVDALKKSGRDLLDKRRLLKESHYRRQTYHRGQEAETITC